MDGEPEVETAKVGTSAFNCSEKVFEILPALAVRIKVAALPTGETAAVNPTLEAFAAVVSTARERAAAAGQGQDRLTDDMQSILSELMQ